MTEIISGPFSYFVTRPIAFVFLFLPAILYRFTLQSTAWLYLPVIWMAHVPAKLRDADRKVVWVKTAGRGWFTLVSAVGVLIYALVLAFDREAFDAMQSANESQMLTPVHLVWAIDPAGWKLWFWVTLPSAAPFVRGTCGSSFGKNARVDRPYLYQFYPSYNEFVVILTANPPRGCQIASPLCRLWG